MLRGFFGNLVFAIIARTLCGNHPKLPQPNLTHCVIVDQNIGPYVVYNVQTVSVKFFRSADPFAKTCQGSVTRVT